MSHTLKLRKKRYTFLVYVELEGFKFMGREAYLNMNGSQSKLRCARYSSFVMMRENVPEIKLVCHVRKC